MPTPTYTPLANLTLGATATTVSFGSVPATARDLILVAQVGVSNSSIVRVRLNSDAGNNYSYQRMEGNGTSATAATASTQAFIQIAMGDGRPTSTSNALIVSNFLDYSATDKHKTVLSRSDNAALGTQALVNRWASTSAITTIQLSLESTFTFSVGSTFALYGIVA